MIAIGPGEPAQLIHRDQWAFDFFPFPSGLRGAVQHHLGGQPDFTEETGATRVIPGSHRFEDKLQLRPRRTRCPAEMATGSVLFYTGALYHGGGANRSDEVRYGLNLTYNLGWLRQEENQYLAVPLEVARDPARAAAAPDGLRARRLRPRLRRRPARSARRAAASGSGPPSGRSATRRRRRAGRRAPFPRWCTSPA